MPELHRYWTRRDWAANVRLFRLAAEVLRAIEAVGFHPVVGWQCKGVRVQEQVLGVEAGVKVEAPGRRWTTWRTLPSPSDTRFIVVAASPSTTDLSGVR